MAPQLPDGVRLLHTLTGHDGTIGRIGWSPDGRLLATPSKDGTVRIWDAHSGAYLRTIGDRGESMFAAAFGSDGRILATGGSGGTSLWDVDSYATGSPAATATASHLVRAAASWRA
jgi:WD40 repeat protein